MKLNLWTVQGLLTNGELWTTDASDPEPFFESWIHNYPASRSSRTRARRTFMMSVARDAQTALVAAAIADGSFAGVNKRERDLLSTALELDPGDLKLGHWSAEVPLLVMEHDIETRRMPTSGQIIEIGFRTPGRAMRTLLQVGALDEMLLDPLFEHGWR